MKNGEIKLEGKEGKLMIRPDIIVAWPLHLDYPLWRQFIHDNRDRFSKIIVIFTQMNTGKDYRPWLQPELSKDNIISVMNDVVEAKDDWRNIAVNCALSLSDAEWVWFTEQDFFPNPNLWEELKLLPKNAEVIGAAQGRRLHPCCIFIKRELLNKTSRDFSAHPPEYDHFGKIQNDLYNFPHAFYNISPKFYDHLNGLSQNMYLLQIGETPNSEPEKFKQYLQKCLQISLPIHPEIKELLEKYVRR